MKIEISYPGQEVQIIDATSGIEDHFLSKGWDLPFVRRIITKEATMWYRWMKSKDGVGHWDFNHLEDGFVEAERPTPKHPSHVQAWAGGDWKREYVKLVNDGYMGTDKAYH